MDDKLKNEILQLWRKGMTDKDIAYELEMPERIVKQFLAKRKADRAESKRGEADGV